MREDTQTTEMLKNVQGVKLPKQCLTVHSKSLVSVHASKSSARWGRAYNTVETRRLKPARSEGNGLTYPFLLRLLALTSSDLPESETQCCSSPAKARESRLCCGGSQLQKSRSKSRTWVMDMASSAVHERPCTKHGGWQAHRGYVGARQGGTVGSDK